MWTQRRGCAHEVGFAMSVADALTLQSRGQWYEGGATPPTRDWATFSPARGLAGRVLEHLAAVELLDRPVVAVVAEPERFEL